MAEHLFVYGTLCPGKPNEHIMESAALGTKLVSKENFEQAVGEQKWAFLASC